MKLNAKRISSAARLLGRYGFALALAAMGTVAHAQVKAYVCDGFDADDVTLESRTDLRFSADKQTVTIGTMSFNVAEVDSIIFTKPQFPCVDISWEGATPVVTVSPGITGITKTVSGGHVTINSSNVTDEILYRLHGTSTDGSLTINGDYKMTLHLDGVSLTSTKGAALDIECGKRIEMKLMKGTVNSFVDKANGAQKAAVYTKGHLEIKGRGTLNVTGRTKHALAAKEYLRFKPSTGTVNILSAVSDGIHCGKGISTKADYENTRFIMDGGEINVAKCGSDCIDSDDYGSAIINDGVLTLNVNQVDGAGLKCDSVLYMNGGTINATVSGAIANGIRFGWDAQMKGGLYKAEVSGAGAKGIKAKKSTKTTDTVRNGGNCHLQGTGVELTVTGGTYTADLSKCVGVRVDANLYQTAGSLSVSVKNGAALGLEVKGEDLKTGGQRAITN